VPARCWYGCQVLPRQLFRAVQIDLRVIAELIRHPDREGDRQPGRGIDRMRVERQRLPEICLGLIVVLSRDRIGQHRAAA